MDCMLPPPRAPTRVERKDGLRLTCFTQLVESENIFNENLTASWYDSATEKKKEIIHPQSFIYPFIIEHKPNILNQSKSWKKEKM